MRNLYSFSFLLAAFWFVLQINTGFGILSIHVKSRGFKRLPPILFHFQTMSRQYCEVRVPRPGGLCIHAFRRRADSQPRDQTSTRRYSNILWQVGSRNFSTVAGVITRSSVQGGKPCLWLSDVIAYLNEPPLMSVLCVRALHVNSVMRRCWHGVNKVLKTCLYYAL